VRGDEQQFAVAEAPPPIFAWIFFEPMVVEIPP
jgi:hypothetical protein